MIIKHTSAGGHEYLVALDQEEYAVIAACLDYGQDVVNAAPDEDEGQAYLSQLVRRMQAQWEAMNKI